MCVPRSPGALSITRNVKGTLTEGSGNWRLRPPTPPTGRLSDGNLGLPSKAPAEPRGALYAFAVTLWSPGMKSLPTTA
jgi:hypothetical protein